MEHEPHPHKPVRPYFLVDRPAHFRFRRDLIEELCIGEAMARSLPKSIETYQAWLEVCGLTPMDYTLSELKKAAAQPYQPTERFVLQTVIRRGNMQVSNILSDGNRWAVVCENYGLFQAVMDRALELADLLGYAPEKMRDKFVIKAKDNAKNFLRFPAWAIGYERGTGLCTVLDVEHPESKKHYLAGRGGYFTPWSEPLNPI